MRYLGDDNFGKVISGGPRIPFYWLFHALGIETLIKNIRVSCKYGTNWENKEKTWRKGYIVEKFLNTQNISGRIHDKLKSRFKLMMQGEMEFNALV